MVVNVKRLGPPVVGHRAGVHTLEQRWLFEGIDAATLGDILWTKPLLGEGSIFGERTGASAEERDDTRQVRSFSPVPGFRFDVIMRRADPKTLVVRFAQPDRATPYLAGEFVWFLSDVEGGALFEEQINTEAAMKLAAEPLSGARTSLRRWLFFRVGHARVMDETLRNIAALA